MKLTDSELLTIFKLIICRIDKKRYQLDNELLKSAATKIASELLDK